mmetsp:Transcript_13010/g.22960  ORF Transcript_13010/g.22960 Transcript_13010/m.22960 type:complete len:470 (+) Transcript_13010:3-1412(+)
MVRGPLGGYQAVVLAGGGASDKGLFPLIGLAAKALMPVANKPLLSYSLKLLSDAGLRHVFVVVNGEEAAAAVIAWLSFEHNAPGKMHCEVIKTPKDGGTADALRAVSSRITSKTLVCLSGDLITDLALNALVAVHKMSDATATVLLNKKKISPASGCSAGKAPKDVDYIGCDASNERLLFYASSPETLRDLRIPLEVVRRYGGITVSSEIMDAHLYVFDKSVLDLIDKHPAWASVRQDVLPFLTQQQLLLTPTQPDLSNVALPTSKSTTDIAGMSGTDGSSDLGALQYPGSNFSDWSHSGPVGPKQHDSALRVHIVQPGIYCARIADIASYGDVSRDLADSKTALSLTGLKPSALHENVVPTTTVLGNKSTISAACLIGEHCSIGDKSSIKRSVLGNNVRLGTNVKIVNSVLFDNVFIMDGSVISNSIVCEGVICKERSQLRDCQVSAGTVVASREYTGEVLGKPQAHA